MNDIFKYKKLNPEKLLSYGFVCKKTSYNAAFPIMGGDFVVNVQISSPNKVQTLTIETETNEPYSLHLTDEEGTFVGQVREEYATVLRDISDKCFDTEIFKSAEAGAIIEYISEKYGDHLEYLWEKFPDNAIARRQDNKKWYLVIMTVRKDKFGFDTTEMVEVVDFRADVDELPSLIKNENIYEGYHMNKKHWITIILDGSMPVVEIYKLLDKSYELAKK